MNLFKVCTIYYRVLLSILILILTSTAYSFQNTIKYTQTQLTKSPLSSQQVLEELKKGNERFLSGEMLHRNYNKQAYITSKMGQAPYAVILSCMDSRGPVEILLDQGIGDVFSLRIAGNVLNQDIIGSMEYGVEVVGAKVIVIMGHTQCGAVGAACKSTELGNLTNLLTKIKPAVNSVLGLRNPDCSEADIDKIAKQNVINMINDLRTQSPIIDKLASDNTILIVGAMHNVRTGKIDFFNGK